MVRDELTDGRRIAELLASELTGLSDGPLADVRVVDADTDVTPTPEGAVAFRVTAGGRRVATVSVRPDAALVAFDRDGLAAASIPDAHLSLDESRGRLTIERGAGVKAAVDVFRAVLTG